MNRFFAFFALFITIAGCKNGSHEPSNDTAFAGYISAYTSGSIPRTTSIRIVFQSGVINPEVLNEVRQDWLSITPNIEGDLIWVNNELLEFKPHEPLPSDTKYRAVLKLGKLTSAPKELGEFVFVWRTYAQAMSVDLGGLSPYNPDEPILQYFTGTVTTNDFAESDRIEQVLSARQGAHERPIRWRHEGGKVHYFTIDSLEREEEAGVVHLRWDGAPIGTDQKGSSDQRIPGLNDFEITSMRVAHQPETHVIIDFSDPIDAKQSLEGLFMLNGNDRMRIVKMRNVVHLYPNARISGETTLEVNGRIRSNLGYALGDDVMQLLMFESVKPAVRFSGVNKSILPSSNKNSIDFEAVNLSAVDVRIIEIYQNNLHQFLQVNNLNGENELKRVGRVIRKKTVTLNPKGDKDLAQWNRFFLDLSDLIATDNGALYRVELGFRKAYSLYPCDQSEDDNDEALASLDGDQWDSDGNEENSYWDFYDSWYYDPYGYDDYDWYERDNPCHSSYYRRHRFAMRNVFATDLAIVAKQGENGTWDAWVTNLMNTNSVSGAKVNWFNYQGQLLHSAATDNQGHTRWENADQQPFIITAERNQQRSILKVSGGESLSLARFDVSGERTQEGMKGFIYTERGVWRPGDTLFVGFMLQDSEKRLPANHPVQLEIIDARGKTAFKTTQLLNQHAHLSWAVPTADEANTGAWQARVRIGNITFNKWLRVETIKPNRLKIKLDFNRDVLVAHTANDRINGNLNVQWLHGAPGKNLRSQIDLTVTSTPTRFSRYSEFTFDDPTREVNMGEINVFDGLVNENGDANISLNISTLDEAPGMLKATFNTRSYEPGGDFSIDVMQMALSPFTRYVGVRLPKGDAARNMLLTDTTHTVMVQGVDEEGRPAGPMNLDYEIYKVQWRWWWQSNDNDLNSYSGRSSMELIRSGALRTDENGEGQFTFKISYPDWGRYLVRVIDREGGHATGQTMYVDWPGWAGRAQRDQNGTETTLSIESDRETYAPGDPAVITFPGADNARALITIENGSGVIQSTWKSVVAGSNQHRIMINPDFAPNVYVSVTLIQPHAQTENDLPMRLYGTKRITVEDPETRLNPIISIDETLEPESNYEVEVSERNGKRMSYTLAVVDEGLLGLTRFSTPDPHKCFYAQEVLGVKTWDVYDDVIGAYGKALKGALTTGGDEGLAGDSKKKVNRFKPVVSFLGPFDLAPGKTVKHQLAMPNYVGAVRVMVVARQEKAYGHVEKSVIVKKPLMVLATLPRIAGVGETLELPVNVFAMDPNVGEVTVEVNTGPYITFGGQSKKTITFTQTGDQLVNFNLVLDQVEGATHAEVIAKSGSIVAKHRIDFAIRNPNPPATVRYTKTIEPGEQFVQAFDLPGVTGSNALKLEVATFAPLNLGERLEYLIGYPHGCLEQTTSRAFPQLYLEHAVELNEQQQMRARQHVAAAITKVQQFQHTNGGFVYWPGQDQPNDWSTSYVGHFLVEARDKGYAVPDRVINDWAKYQDEIARNWRNARDMYRDDALAQAYRLFTLALAGKPNLGAMNRLRELKPISTTAKWQLAAAYLIAGRSDAAASLISQTETALKMENHISFDYGSVDRDRALICYALVLAGQRSEAANLVQELTKRLSSPQPMSTQETSFALAAIGRFLENEGQRSASFTLDFNDKKYGKTHMQRAAFVTELPVTRMNGNRLTVVNTSDRTLYLQLAASGQPAEDRLPAASNGIRLEVNYLLPDGEPIDVSEIAQGTDFVAIVKVSATDTRTSLRDVALTQVFPSGWEIINERLMAKPLSWLESSTATYRDVRDDRVNTYFDVPPAQTMTFFVRLNAAYLGKFFLPAASVELMYDGTKNARTQGRWVSVVRPGVL